MFQKSQILGENNLLRKIFIQLIVLAMFIAFIPFGNFASVAAEEQSPKEISKEKEKLEVVIFMLPC